MYNFFKMKIIDGFDHLLEYISSIFFIQTTFTIQTIKELSSFTKTK